MLKEFYSEELIEKCNNTYLLMDENFSLIAVDRKDLPEDFNYGDYVKAISEWIPD